MQDALVSKEKVAAIEYFMTRKVDFGRFVHSDLYLTSINSFYSTFYIVM